MGLNSINKCNTLFGPDTFTRTSPKTSGVINVVGKKIQQAAGAVASKLSQNIAGTEKSTSILEGNSLKLPQLGSDKFIKSSL